MSDNYILDFFKKAIAKGRLAHGYLFWGPDYKEMKEVAFWLADFLKTSPFDILYIIPDAGKKEISIEQIRKAIKHLSLSPYNSSYKFAIIDRAETMKLDASDALLKTLEEPLGNTILILISSKPDLLPRTIVSRLQEIRFKPIPLNRIAKEFIKQEHINILKKPVNDIFKYIEEISKNNAEIFSLLDSWLFWFRDLLLKKTDNKYLKILREIQKTKDLISITNVNQRLALENLALCIKS